jgi:hypothetical protein
MAAHTGHSIGDHKLLPDEALDAIAALNAALPQGVALRLEFDSHRDCLGVEQQRELTVTVGDHRVEAELRHLWRELGDVLVPVAIRPVGFF